MVSKRDVLEILKDGKTRTIDQILVELGLDGSKVNALRTTMNRCYNDGYTCEVLPRDGRKKLWKSAMVAVDEINNDIPAIKDDGATIRSSINKPDKFRFHENCFYT